MPEVYVLECLDCRPSKASRSFSSEGARARFAVAHAEAYGHRKWWGRTRAGFVYVMQSGTLYKIGWANDPAARQRDLQVGNPQSVVLVGTREGSKADEGRWHRTFQAKRVRGEWFALTDEDVRLIGLKLWPST